MAKPNIDVKASHDPVVRCREATEQRMIELLAIDDLPERIAEFQALLKVVTDERKALVTVLEFLDQHNKACSHDILSDTEKHRLARWVGALGFTFPHVLERLAHAFATEFGKA